MSAVASKTLSARYKAAILTPQTALKAAYS